MLPKFWLGSVGSQPATERVADNAVDDPLKPVERISRLPSIASLLERVRKARCLLTIRLPGERQTFSSVLLRVSSSEAYMLVDELVPRYGNDLMTPGIRASISAFYQGASLEMDATVEAVTSENNAPIFRIELPESLGVTHRRQHHRVELPIGASVPVHCTVGSNRLLSGELQNISLGGLCFQADKRQTRDIAVGDVIKRCVINAHGDVRIVATVEVRSVSPLSAQSSLRRFGVRFMDLDHKSLQRLQQLVVSLERSELRDRRQKV